MNWLFLFWLLFPACAFISLCVIGSILTWRQERLQARVAAIHRPNAHEQRRAARLRLRTAERAAPSCNYAKFLRRFLDRRLQRDVADDVRGHIIACHRCLNEAAAIAYESDQRKEELAQRITDPGIPGLDDRGED